VARGQAADANRAPERTHPTGAETLSLSFSFSLSFDRAQAPFCVALFFLFLIFDHPFYLFVSR
jgi:hypothetical protein